MYTHLDIPSLKRSSSIRKELILQLDMEMKMNLLIGEVVVLHVLCLLEGVVAIPARTTSPSRTEQPFKWMCGMDICTLGLQYCDDISEPAVCERCNEDVCNGEFPPSQCFQACHPTEISTPTVYTPSVQSTPGIPFIRSEKAPGVNPAIYALSAFIVVLFIYSIFITVLHCYYRHRKQPRTGRDMEQPTTQDISDYHPTTHM